MTPLANGAETAPPFVRVHGVCKSFGDVQVLHDVTLDVPDRGLLAVLGRSGSGKTTLLRVIAGFERIDRGTISIGGSVVAGPGAHVAVERRHIGYVAQEGALFPHLNVAQNVLFGLDRASRRDLVRAERLLDMVGLPTRMAGRRPAELSGGEQQRVALARALSTRPRLVLLDEPFSALDAGLRAETRRAVADALAEAGAAAFLVTHDQSEALSMGDEVAILRGGRLAQRGTPETIYRAPADAALALFVGEANLVSATVRAGRADTPLGLLRLAVDLPDGRATVMVRPEQLVPATGDADGVEAIVQSCGFHGPDVAVLLALVQPPGGALKLRLAGHLAPRQGDRLRLMVEGPVMGWTALPGTAPLAD